MDLSKLTPMPWDLRQDRDGEVQLRPGCFWTQEDMDFINLSSAAFEVMMRRGWHSEKVTPEMGWAAYDWEGTRIGKEDESNCWLTPPITSDPFTALVEADRWYKENVE